MTPLVDYMLENDFTNEAMVDAMNRLQENGIISDLCMTPGDIWEGDAVKAVEWLKENP